MNHRNVGQPDFPYRRDNREDTASRLLKLNDAQDKVRDKVQMINFECLI